MNNIPCLSVILLNEINVLLDCGGIYQEITQSGKQEFVLCELTKSDVAMKSMIDEIFKNDSFWLSDDIKKEMGLLFDTIPGVGIRRFTAKILGRYGIVLKRWNKTLSDGSRKDGYRITRPSCR